MRTECTAEQIEFHQLGTPLPIPPYGELRDGIYVLLLRLPSDAARQFYETEALRGGWSVRQLRRQIDSQFYERTARSHDKPSMLATGSKRNDDDVITPAEAIKDPYWLEFLDLKDEYQRAILRQH